MSTHLKISNKQGLFNFILNQDKDALAKRVEKFNTLLTRIKAKEHYSYQRPILNSSGTEVIIHDKYTAQPKKMLMFASNNYLGLANHPYVKKKVLKSINTHGVGMAGPPLLNGYSGQMQVLEEKISAFKGTEATIIFPTGFMANIGVISALAKKKDIVIHDKLSHASLYSGLQMSDCKRARFPHNNVEIMEKLIAKQRKVHSTVFVSMEGVYSMDGDIAPLDKMVPICKKYDAISLLDDAHGVGVLGKNGRGTAELLGIEEQIDIHMGTFSKVFSVTGGYLSGPKNMIEYLRYFTSSYVFSAALPPMVLAAVNAGIDVIQQEPERRLRVLDIADFAFHQLKGFGVEKKPAAAIIPIKIPKDMNIRQANRQLHELGIFINAVEYPAVGFGKERFRVSITSDHTKTDILKLANCLDKVWNDPNCRNK